MSDQPIGSEEDFLQGQIDCQNGVPHQDGQSVDYDRGYATQYQHEQSFTARSQP